jgi:hypothetical protein
MTRSQLFRKYPFGVISVFYIMLLTFVACGFWLRVESLEDLFFYFPVFFLLEVPLVLQIIYRNKAGWILICLAGLILFLGIDYEKFLRHPPFIKSGFTESHYLTRLFFDICRTIGGVILFGIITFPRTGRFFLLKRPLPSSRFGRLLRDHGSD